MQTLKERYVQKNRNKLIHESHRRKMLIIEAIEQAQLEKTSALIKKLDNFKQLVPDFSPAIDPHLEALRQQKFGGEVARAVGFVASLEAGFSQLGQVLPNFFGEKEFNDPKNEKNSIEDLLSGDPSQKKKFEALIKKVFSRTDGFWNKLKSFVKGPRSQIGEMIDVASLKDTLLGVSVGALKKAVQNFAAGPQADDMKKDVAAVVKADPSTGGGGAPSGGGSGGGGAPSGGAPSGGGGGKVNVDKLTQDALAALKYKGKDGVRVVKKTILWLDKNNKLKEAFEKGALNLVID